VKLHERCSLEKEEKTMSYSAEIIDYKGKEAVALTAGKYKAIVAPFFRQ